MYLHGYYFLTKLPAIDNMYGNIWNVKKSFGKIEFLLQYCDDGKLLYRCITNKFSHILGSIRINTFGTGVLPFSISYVILSYNFNKYVHERFLRLKLNFEIDLFIKTHDENNTSARLLIF